MNYPPCFESQEQYDAWEEAADQVFHKHGQSYGRTPYCADCTPTYAARMRLEGRCWHTEVKFYRNGKAFLGVSSGRIMEEGKWEPVDEPDATKFGINA